MHADTAILTSVERYITDYFENNISKNYTFHDIHHTLHVVEAVREIGESYNLSAKELNLLEIAAWFHDTGYNIGPENHEQRACEHARTFLENHGYKEEQIDQVNKCIMATRLPQEPQSLMEGIICDADLSHLGKPIYWERCGKIRQEFGRTKGMEMTEEEWINFELSFLTDQKYHTKVAKQLYNKRKYKHIKQLLQQKMRIRPDSLNETELKLLEKVDKKKNKKPKKKSLNNNIESNQLRLGRGVETMYRTTYRTHINLSSIADNKANIMLSINAIIISITISTLVPNFGENPTLILPTIVLLSVCLTAVVFATLSTMPKITEGKIDRQDIVNRRSNLLFFGNFYNMKLPDFHWGMMEMIKDNDFLYSSMTRDLYYLGIVLAKKYRYLRICYRIFMFGLIFAVACFAIAFLLF